MKYTIKHSCGHTVEVEITGRLEKWELDNRGKRICPTCEWSVKAGQKMRVVDFMLHGFFFVVEYFPGATAAEDDIAQVVSIMFCGIKLEPESVGALERAYKNEILRECRRVHDGY